MSFVLVIKCTVRFLNCFVTFIFGINFRRWRRKLMDLIRFSHAFHVLLHHNYIVKLNIKILLLCI